MRIALITLALTALVFIGSIIYSLAAKDGGFSLASKSSIQSPETPIELETLKYQIKNEEKIKELIAKVETLTAAQNGGVLPEVTVSSGKTATGKTVIPLSGKFLAKVMPALEFSLTVNTGIYDLLIFDKSIEYTTYLDAKQGIKAIALSTKYDTFLKNMKALSSEAYTVNETKTFPFRSFYVNPTKADTLIRLVIEVESQCIVIEVPKTKFPTFKALLLKK
jgi:hypothetical protein